MTPGIYGSRRRRRRWLVLAIALGASACGALLTGCATFDLDSVSREQSHALENPEETALARMVAPAPDTPDPTQSGFMLLDRGENALLWRGALTGAARHSIDAQYFIWRDDNVGILAAEGLLRAAERGVRVRVLIDDLGLFAEAAQLSRLDAHPDIEVRLYNPTGVRVNSQFQRMLSVLGDFSRLNRRMHNKAFIVDGSVAIIGGRNIANEYYDLDPEYNFRDRDLLVAGPLVREISGSFDLFWNSEWTAPVSAIAPVDDTPEELAAWYAGLHRHAADPANFPPRFRAALDDVASRLPGLGDDLLRADAELFYDLPGKNEDLGRLDGYGRSGEALTAAALETRRELLAETPYLVLLPGTFDVVERLRARGVVIRVLTNSFETRDSIFPYSCYARQRHELLRAGIGIHETRPWPASQALLMERLRLVESRPIWAIHAKTAVFDRERVYIGTFNMDPRSTHLNTELGVLIDSPALAAEVADLIEYDMAPENSWRVFLGDDGDVLRQTERGGRLETGAQESGIGLFDRLGLGLLGLVYGCAFS